MVWLYIDASDVGELESKDVKKSFTQRVEKKSIQWLDKFAKQETDYSLPATELYIQLDDLSNTYRHKVYNFDFEKISEYNFFCIKQILDSKNVVYSFYKADDSLKLNVVTNKNSIINDIFQEFKQYDINYKVKEIKEVKK
jgi:hypothetical protein